MPARGANDSAEYEAAPMTDERRKFLRDMEKSQRGVNAEYDKSAEELRRGYEDDTVSPEVQKQLEQEAEDKKFRAAAERAFRRNYSAGGKVKAAKAKSSKGRGDGCCKKGHTKGRMV